MGLRSDVKIETIDGPKMIGDLAAICAEEPEFTIPVISWSGSKVFIVPARDFRCLGERQVIIVELDDGNKIYMSGSSQLLLRRGDYILPQESQDASLLPFYTGFDRDGHRTFREPNKKTKPIKFSRLAAAYQLGRPVEFGDYVELKDKDKKNYNPNNLKITHNKEKATKTRTYEITKIADETQALLGELLKAAPGRQKGPKKGKNHRVVASEFGPMEPVFTATIDGAEVVAVSDVFVKLSSY